MVMRAVAATVALLALLAGCSKPSPTEQKRVAKNDVILGDAGPAAAPATVTVAEIVTMFRAAIGCAPRCREADQLRAVMRAQPDDAAAAALEIMADPASKTDAGVGQEALFFLDDWLDTAVDPDTLRRTSKALERVIAEGQTYMRRSAYSFLAQRRLPDAKRIFIAEAENPARDNGERAGAGSGLGVVIDDFSFIKRWLSDDQPLHWYAGLHAMDSFDQDGREQREAEERALVVALGNRPELPWEVVYDLASYYEAYLHNDPNDAEIRALAERWAKDPNDMAAGQMRKILVGYPATR